MDFLRKLLLHIRKFEAQYPGAFFTAIIIAVLALSDLFLKTTIHDYRYIWYRLFESGGKALFHILGGSREVNIESFYDPHTWILSIKHQLASVLAMYAISSNITWKRGLYAIGWFIAIQFLGIIKYALTIKLSLNNPDNLFAISEQPFHLVLWLSPLLVGLKINKLAFNSLWKRDAKHSLNGYCLLVMRIFGILTIMSTFRIIDLGITNMLFQGTRMSLWETGVYLSDVILRWPVLHGANIVLQQFLYNTYIEGHTVTNGITHILLGAPCLGKGVLIVFSIIIILTNTTWLHKLKCIFSGLIVLIMFNIARMSLLFAFVYQFGSSSYNYQTWHDIYSSIIYLAIVGLWIICTSNKFQPAK